MNPEQQPNEPEHTPLVQAPPENPMPPAPGELPSAPKKSHKTLGLILLIGPSALFILAILVSALSNLVASSGVDNPLVTAMNVFAFLGGAITVLTWLPGIIIGIILLAKK